MKTEIHTDNAESHSGKLENRFDKAAVQNELATQIKATSEFQSITLAEIEQQANNKAEVLKQEAKEANAKGNHQEAERLQTEASKWEKGGSYRQALSAVTNGIGLALGGAPTEGIVAGAVSPYVNTEIKKATEGNDMANILAHGVWGAIEAATQGRNALGGATAAMTGEAGAKVLSNVLYGQDNPKNLTNEQKETVSSLSQQLAGIASGATSLATGSNSVTVAQNATAGMGIAKNAVENNYLSKQDWIDYKREISACGNNQECIKEVKDEFSDINRANSENLKAACRLGGSSKACVEHTKAAQEGFDYARTNIQFDGSGWMASVMNTNKKEAKSEPSQGLLGSEIISGIEKALSDPNIRSRLENDPVTKSNLEKSIDQAAKAVRTEKSNAYEFSARMEYPNIAGLSNNYSVFGQELGLEPVIPEYYIYSVLGAGKIGKSLFDLSSPSTRLIVGANGVVSAGSQYVTNGEISLKDTAKDMAEAYITKDFSFKTYTAWNLGAGFLEGSLENAKWQDGRLQGFSVENGLERASAKTVTSTLGYGLGKGVESTLNKNINTYGNSLRTEPIRAGSPISRFVEPSLMPVGVGNVVDSSISKFSEYQFNNLKLSNEVKE